MIRPSDEWRTVFQFDLSGVPATYSMIQLEMPLHCLDAGAPPGELELVAFHGNGTIDIAQFDVGSVYTTFLAVTGEYPTLSLDVTTLVATAISGGATHIAFRLQAGATADRYDLGATGGVTAPLLAISP